MASIALGLSDVRSISLTARDFGRVQLHGNNASYGFLLRVCALAYEALLPEPGTGRFRFSDLLADPQTMGLIFQDFVRNFFRLEQNQFAVKGDQIHWSIDDAVGCGHYLMPTMYTDTSLYDGTRTIIIECKWTPNTLQIGRGAKTLRSEHLYQLHAYMTQHARTQQHSGTVEGLLLYPLADVPVDVAVTLKGQWIRVRTINLRLSWPDIRDQLLDLLRDASPVLNLDPANVTTPRHQRAITGAGTSCEDFGRVDAEAQGDHRAGDRHHAIFKPDVRPADFQGGRDLPEQ
jgi:5-methylcytosine-specific restriction enzyme subunit McrC